MRRRDVLLGVAAGSVSLVLPVRGFAAALTNGNKISLRCLGDRAGPRFLDGRTHDGTVGLAPKTGKEFTGTQWKVYRSGDSVWLQCQGHLQGPRWLDGRTHDGTVGLAPGNKAPYTGTRWKVVRLDDADPDVVALQCLGNVEGPRWLDGRTHDGTVWLAPKTEKPFTGTRWKVQNYAGTIDEGTNLVPDSN